MKQRALGGWGRLPTADVEVLTPETSQGCIQAWRSSGSRISRGLGRAYGDAALPLEGGLALATTGTNRYLSFEENTGELVAEAGLSLDDIIETFLPRGWFPPVVPGTKFVTLGGAAAADIHGKNHHIDGTFGQYVAWLDLLLVSGEIRRCSPVENVELFKATIGGMGLTGHILRVSLRLRRVESAWCRVRYLKSRCLSQTLTLLSEHDVAYRHTVAWMDCMAGGAGLGRGVLMLGNEAKLADLPADLAPTPLRLPERRRWRVPFDFPSCALGPFTVGLFNKLYYGLAREGERWVDFEKFFFPLDAIKDWNRIYGRRGFAQFQVHFPDETAEAGLQASLLAISRSRQASFLAVLKRCGPANDFLLSFLGPGYTLALDLPGPAAALEPLMRELDGVLKQFRGRIYFAKDACVSPTLIPGMYPRLAEFRAIQRAADPTGLIRSRLSQRLNLHD